ncbi:hypothetical protein EK21DRAFT_103721 [Setomelanomma holmii]|uniref:Uncharacterized protein n=1 Tax=Setomelanomma holmii TaxID=210430 RepID=A0A9P4H1U2_9PLEO|nr:hypothetical protein EK21DRAFT_103721 [Setomelanomma holmii]
MEKIKSLVQKSEDATHDAHTASSGTHHDSQSTPIYDQMTGHEGNTTGTTHSTTTDSSTPAGQTGASTGLGDSSRPNVSPTGAGHIHEGISEASIKSGVIGFGTGERQEHAALSSHNPSTDVNRDHILGGGATGTGPTDRDPADQPSTLKQALPLSGNSASDQPHSNTGALGRATQSSTTQQPFEQSLRQESYTKDTDRSFPLAGGVAHKHDPSTTLSTEHHTSSSQYPTQQTSSATHPITGDREPGTKEREVSAREGHGREGLAGAAAAATAVGGASALSHSHEKEALARGQETRQAPYDAQPTTSTGTSQSHHPEAVVAATAAAAKYGNSSNSGFSQGARNTERVDGGRPPGGRSISYRHVPGGFPTPTPDESKTFLYYKDDVVPEPGADGPILTGEQLKPDHTHFGHHSTSHSTGSSRDPALASGLAGGVAGATAGGLAASHGTQHAADGNDNVTHSAETSTTQPHSSSILNKLDPRVKDTPSTQHESSHAPASGAPIAASSSTTGSTGQHELRHTGSIEQPRPKSSGLSDEHHHGRDAAIAGGIGAGAAGLGYAATRDRDTANAGGNTLPQEASPYSSHKLDPRVLGDKGKLEQQRYDPQAKTQPGSLHTPQTAAVAGVPLASGHTASSSDQGTSLEGPVHKSSLLNKLDPRVKETSSKADTSYEPSTTTTQDDQKHHLGRDAALVGAGGATAVGAREALHRNDTPGTGTFVHPQEQTSSTTGPVSSSTTAPQHTSAPLSSSTTTTPSQTAQSSAPLSSTATDNSTTDPSSKSKEYDTYHGPMTTDGKPFYGTAGAPAPIADRSHQGAVASPTTAPDRQSQDTHHYGRDAGLAGAGAATAGGLAYAAQHDSKADSVPTTITTTAPQTSNIASSTTVPPSRSIAGTTIGSQATTTSSTTTGPHHSDTLNRADPRVDEKADQQSQHHLGRDAAIVGGTGAAGYGAYEAAQAYGDHRSTQPGASMNEQRYDTTAHGAHAPNPVPVAGHYDYNNDNTSRDVALGSGAALGAGALGGAAYAGSKHADNTQHVPTSSTQPLSSSTHPASDQPKQDHTKRDAALLGGAGAAAAGGAAYGHSQHKDAEFEREQEKEAHKHEKEAYKHDKAVAVAEKEQHKHEKEQEKEAHRLEKEREKEAARLEKEREKEVEGEEKKKHGILGFLHRDKSKKEKRISADSSPRQSSELDNKRYSKEYAAAGGAVALGAGTTAAAYGHDSDSNDPNSPRWKGKNKLHKDPPKGHPAREAMEHHEMGDVSGKREHVGVDGPIGRPDAISGYQETRSGVYGAQPINEIPGNNIKIEPHTGLPMNVGRYGDGAGGTDANPTVEGHHRVAGVDESLGSGQGTTDWADVKKKDTIY